MMKRLFAKYREIIMYLIFGVLTTVVGVGTYTLIMTLAGRAFDLSDKTAALYLGVYAAAQVIQWVAAVLFSFFTNRKWVFTEARPEPVWRQLITFSASRVVTLGLDVVMTYLGVLLFAAIRPDGLTLIVHFSPEFMAKCVASVVVVVGNYVLSKVLCFESDFASRRREEGGKAPRSLPPPESPSQTPLHNPQIYAILYLYYPPPYTERSTPWSIYMKSSSSPSTSSSPSPP